MWVAEMHMLNMDEWTYLKNIIRNEYINKGFRATEI